LSFIGGKPCLPSDKTVPVCKLCGAEQTFFYQVAFPKGHIWENTSMAVFFCTSCVDENYLIPKMIDDVLLDANIKKGFLND
jgi:hypothetical protein